MTTLLIRKNGFIKKGKTTNKNKLYSQVKLVCVPPNSTAVPLIILINEGGEIHQVGVHNSYT